MILFLIIILNHPNGIWTIEDNHFMLKILIYSLDKDKPLPLFHGNLDALPPYLCYYYLFVAYSIARHTVHAIGCAYQLAVNRIESNALAIVQTRYRHYAILCRCKHPARLCRIDVRWTIQASVNPI